MIFTIFFKIFPMESLAWPRLLITTIEFTIFKKIVRRILSTLEVQHYGPRQRQHDDYDGSDHVPKSARVE